MVVDDSAAIRGVLVKTLESDPQMEIVATATNGQVALEALARFDVEVVVLDIEMPVMDGLAALPKLLAAKPGLKVIMASTLTLRNAEISLKALTLGAADYIPKPTSSGAINAAEDFRRDLIAKVRALGAAKRGHKAVTSKPVAGSAPATESSLYRGKTIKLRPVGRERPELLAIGSSTGGPQALTALFAELKTGIKRPILITQHMPPTFTAILAEHIARASGMPAKEAVQDEIVRDGHIYVAPGDFHMLVERNGTERKLKLVKTPPENFCRPAVDPMLRSLVESYGGRFLTVILTGMGQDGMLGSRKVVEAGGTVIAQDEESSVVWGMPGAVATDGLCSAVLPLKKLAGEILKFLGGGRT
jgi:two-component system, chemotaxis family, protein-glutamate methylesterase/glutaminase